MSQSLKTATLFVTMLGVAAISLPAHGEGRSGAYFTAPQARAGARDYAVYCATCHGTDLRGPQLPLKGPAFASLGHDTGMTLGQFFDFVVRDTPAGSLHSLTHAQYAEIMAYIMQQNGYPSGNEPLRFDRALHLKARIAEQTVGAAR